MYAQNLRIGYFSYFSLDSGSVRIADRSSYHLLHGIECLNTVLSEHKKITNLFNKLKEKSNVDSSSHYCILHKVAYYYVVVISE